MKKFLLLALMGATTCILASDGATIYKKCQVCHGQKAEKKYMNKVPALSTLKADYIVQALEGYKAGTNNKYKTGMLMKGQVAALSKDDMKNVADHIVKTFGKK
ncbi:MAG: cytochrome C [Proteobacteria bacterium]|nr:MAG: cytochrome C [Pseudomonadota bacterium]